LNVLGKLIALGLADIFLLVSGGIGQASGNEGCGGRSAAGAGCKKEGSTGKFALRGLHDVSSPRYKSICKE
jgi:hypothetical protein